MPSTAAPIVPIEKLELTSALAKLRRCGGANSTVSAIPVGISPPSPMPARKRNRPNRSAEGARAQPTMNSEKTLTLAISIRRRPSRSVAIPQTSVPTSMPMSAALAITPTWAASRPHGS